MCVIDVAQQDTEGAAHLFVRGDQLLAVLVTVRRDVAGDVTIPLAEGLCVAAGQVDMDLIEQHAGDRRLTRGRGIVRGDVVLNAVDPIDVEHGGPDLDHFHCRTPTGDE